MRSNTLTKLEIAQYLRKTLKIQEVQALDFVSQFFESIAEQLAQGQVLNFSGFGHFTVHFKKERPGRNLKTQEMVTIRPRSVLKFKTGKKLGDAIQEGIKALDSVL